MDESYGGTMDYKLVCRTCLTADAEFYKLSAPIICDEDDEEKTSFQECLRYCTHLEDVSQYPIYICTECSTALQVSYNFIRNAVEAHEILRQKLCPAQQRNNGGLHMGTSSSSIGGDDESGCGGAVGRRGEGRTDIASGSDMDKKMRFRCKICNEKVETKKSLKEHVKLHLDIISYCCKMCNYESKKRSHLSNHYSAAHGMEPTRDQLKPKTLVHQPKIEEDARVKNERDNDKFETFSQNDDEIYLQMEKIHNSANNPDADYDDDELLKEQRQQLFELEHQLELEQQQKQQQVLQQEQQLDEDIAMANVIPTVINNDNIQDFRNDFTVAANELSIGNEFIVMADGSVEEVMENGVVIEYINAADDGVTLENGLVLNDIVQVEQHTTSNPDDVVLDNNGTNAMNMDVDDMIIEENVMAEDMPSIEDDIPQSIITVSGVTAGNEKKIKCKICADNFSTQEKLKTHMLTHNEIPHFFCDQCTFYTFFKIDLTQHYKTKHKLQPTFKQLQPKNKVKTEVDTRHIYTCDLCLFETYVKVNLRRHYLSKHQVEATDVQLRPTLDETDLDALPIVRTPKKKQSAKPPKPDYPHGMNCKKCFKTFYYRNKLKEHYKRHNLELDVDTLESNSFGMQTISQHQPQHQREQHQHHQQQTTATIKYNAQEDYIFAEQQNEHQQTSNMLDNTRTTNTPAYTTTTNSIINKPLTTPTTITTTTSTGYSALPSDAIPQIVETDTAIDNDIDFDFNDALFEDFEDDDDENDNDDDDNEQLQDLLLTSEDDFEDVLEEQQQQQQNHDTNNDNILNSMPQPYCIHCNKKFFSQYQFENHMFVHRGLAPYRCEMCTNLYNTKRALIRHYTAVHKRVPTRDMIQAKGDKVSVDRTPIEHLNLQEQKAITLMCAKCPYESTELLNLQIHLSTSHGISDESFILQKLSFECPRCIRSYVSKLRLIRHLERSHSVATIIQQQSQLASVESSSSTSTTPASTASNSRCGIVELTPIASTSSIDINDEITVKEEINTITATIKAETATESTLIPTSSTTTSIESETKLIQKSHYNCKACDFVCSTIELLNEHSKSHPSDDIRTNFNFECSICSCKYKTIEALKYHMKRHIARKYRCKQCPKSYINRGELNNHLLLHTGEMPHKCDMCNKKFRYSHHLKRHRDVLHYGKRFRCPTDGCERFFTTQAQMKIHTWTHNGNVPYKCKYCDRDFIKRESLRQHARKVHNVNLTEEEIAEIFRNVVGHTNPHDFTVSVSNGKMVRRSEVEAAEAESEIFLQNSCSNLPNDDDENLD